MTSYNDDHDDHDGVLARVSWLEYSIELLRFSHAFVSQA